MSDFHMPDSWYEPPGMVVCAECGGEVCEEEYQHCADCRAELDLDESIYYDREPDPDRKRDERWD